MGREDPKPHVNELTSWLVCDLTQSWSDVGGGVGTYLRRKRAYILDKTTHRHLMILPGPRDEVIDEGRAVTVFIASPKVPGSPHYRLLLRNSAVRRALERFRPDLIECQDAYNLPWSALAYRRRHPETALVAGYFTDFPTVYVKRPFAKFVGRGVANAVSWLCYRYCGALYSRFDAVYGLSENGGVSKLKQGGVDDVAVVPLGVELDEFDTSRRDRPLRHSLGVEDDQPLLIYAGRLDGEKRPQVVVDAFRQLPAAMGATLVLLGDGPMRAQFCELGKTMRVIAPGFVNGRAELARWLASADIYVSAMADETFGISVIEAQASGLPVVGVAAGAMVDRVTPETGRLGPIDDPAAMARNIVEVWGSEPKAMGLAAREHVRHRFAWDQSMESLFGSVYRQAFARRAAWAGRQSAAVGLTLADA
jgi:alpha-1,6-mannosyltransferase